MYTSFLDSFQLIAAVYLFYAAIKGEGTLYNFIGIPKGQEKAFNKKLRIFYLICGFIALVDTGVSMLQNNMFSVEYTETGKNITQNFTISWLPNLTYDGLGTASLILSVILIGLLIWLFFFTKKITNGGLKDRG